MGGDDRGHIVRLNAWSVEVTLVLRWKKSGTRPAFCGARSRAPKVIVGQEDNRDKYHDGVSGLLSVFPWVLGVTQVTGVHDKDLHTRSHLASLKREVTGLNHKSLTRVVPDHRPLTTGQVCSQGVSHLCSKVCQSLVAATLGNHAQETFLDWLLWA